MNSVRRMDLLLWVREKLQGIKHDPGAPPKLLVILPSNIVVNNFVRAAQSQGIRTDSVEALTFEELAERIVGEAGGGPVEVLDAQILGDLIQHLIRTSKTPELSVFEALPIEQRETLSAIVDEYDEYLRASLVGTLHNELLDAVKLLKSDYEKETTARRLDAFKALESEVSKELRKLHPTVFQTRGHLLKAAKERVPKNWPKYLDNIEAIAVAAVTVLDSLTTDLLLALGTLSSSRGFSIDVLCGQGTFSGMAMRFAKSWNMPSGTDESLGQSVLQATLKASVQTRRVSLPDQRREVLFLASELRKLLLSGTRPSEILLIARDCGEYLSFVKDVFPSYGIPYYLQTRRLYAHLHQYGFMRALLELAALVEQGERIPWDTLTSPLRLGFCTPGSRSGWPVEAREVFYLEERLSWIQNAENPDGLSLPEWKAQSLAKLGWDSARLRILKFIGDVEQLTAISPSHAKSVIRALKDFWQAFVDRQSTWQSEWSDPRIDQNERFALVSRHPTSFEGQLRRELEGLEGYLLDYPSLSGTPLTWKQISHAFARLVLSGTYGFSELDRAAVPFVDAGNAWFREAKHVFLLGMRSEGFPRKCPEGKILQNEFRKKVEPGAKGISPLLYLRNQENDYDSDCDFFEACLRTATHTVTFTMPYLDVRGHSQAWSPFVTELKDAPERYAPDYWLPVLDTRSKLAIDELAPWARWNLFIYHQHRQDTLGPAAIKKQVLQELGAAIDRKQYETEILPRITRYINPPREIVVSAKESWIGEPLLLKLAGPPYHAHELDLHAICPMQFYFYQFLYNLWGEEYSRESIPPSHQKLRWRYGPIPILLSHLYADSLTIGTISKCMSIWPSRDELANLANENELRGSLAKVTNSFGLRQVLAPFVGDWFVALNERKTSSVRNWEWIKGGDSITISSSGTSAEVFLPPHRLDRLNGCVLAITYVNYSQQIKRVWLAPRDHRGRYYSVPQDYAGYALPILLCYYEDKWPKKLAGAFYVELFSGARRGYFHIALRSKHRENPPATDQLTPIEWNRRLTEFNGAIAKRVAHMTATKTARYERTHLLTSCGECVYSTLCNWEGEY